MIAVFLGPTLSRADAIAELDAEYHPPAGQGDIYRAASRRATAIGIVDGFFRQVPSVWHKELLWALAERIPVYGSASMGALRAAELCTYGMVGVGTIFEAYRDATISDDDEVALTHLGPEDGYRATSIPMVDIRATLEAAERDGVISDAASAFLTDVAKALWYPKRTYRTLVRRARAGWDGAELDEFAAWWPTGQVSRKREDALAMLRRIRDDAVNGTWPSPPQFWFERTALYDELTRTAGAADVDGAASAEAAAYELGHAAAGAARDGALARVLALDEARRLQYTIDEDRLYDAVIRFRAERGLLEPSDLEEWMAANNLDRTQFLRLVADEARLSWVRSVVEPEVESIMADYLRVSGQFERGGAA